LACGGSSSATGIAPPHRPDGRCGALPGHREGKHVRRLERSAARRPTVVSIARTANPAA
jgi:hypothetical protein